jgi:ATP-binding cassette subfamily C protein LapB
MQNEAEPKAGEEAVEVKPFTRLDDSLLRSVSWICHHYGLGKTDQGLLAGLPRAGSLTPSLALKALENAGLTGGLVERGLQELPEQVMPIILIRDGSAGCIVLSRRAFVNSDGKRDLAYQIILPEVSDQPVEVPHAELMTYYAGYAILVKPMAKVETSDSDPLPQPKGHWLFSTLWRYRRYYRSAAIAAVLVNLLALASVFFTMNVYDRVIPNQAFVTLWSLAIGVTLAMVFEAVTRYIRAHLIDVAGKKADLVLGSILFRQALAVRMEHKPASSGSFANQIREFESVRDFIASATLAVITDLPFVLLFLGVIFAIGGPLAWIPTLMIPLIIVVSVGIQWPLARVMKDNLREASLKQGVLIESIEGMETLKSTNGEAWMQRRWQRFSAMQSASGTRSKQYSAIATGVAAFLQQFQTVALIVTGVYLIDAGTLTMGALIGTVMLAGRCTAPLSQVVGLAVRFQQAKAALDALNKLMEMPVDRDKTCSYLPHPEISGNIKLQGVNFSYPAPPMQPNPEVLKGVSLSIQAGERVAIIGRIGSGKSTLLRLIARLYQPVKGQMFADDLDVSQIDPADWHRSVGFVGQSARLFHGTLRENVMIGCQDATARELLRVLKLTGLDQVAARHPAGINLPVGESGDSLSGGQRQLIALARTLIANPTLLLMDEPTSAMDSQTEQYFITQLKLAVQQQTLIVVTHRPSMLALVDRIIVVEEGQIVLDGPKDTVLAKLQQKPATPAASRVNRVHSVDAAMPPAGNSSTAPEHQPASV